MNLPNPLDPSDVVAAFPEYNIDPNSLGDGGMKSAFRINEEEPRVLKIVREPLPKDVLEGAMSLPERIRREIEGMRTIIHPRIVPILAGPDVRQIGDGLRVWYLEPLFPGGPLSDRLTGPLPETDCIALLSALVDAAEVLAAHNVVHRDIKPGNIVFDAHGAPVLLDLGIAYFQDLTPLTDNWGQSPKTPMYAAPEQFEMRMQTPIDFRTDLFLIGIVVFEALTGVHPFGPSDPGGYFERLRKGEWNRNAVDNINASPGMERILARLLDPSMSRRYRRFDHLRNAIGECG